MEPRPDEADKVPMTIQRSFRIPVELDDWIRKLSPEYGTTYQAKVTSLLYRGKKKLEREMLLIADDELVSVDSIRKDREPPNENAG
jgi:hypothetical protein